MAYKTFVIDQMINYDEFNIMIDNGITIEASTLLLDQFKCPDNWIQCPLSGNCILEEKQCDKYADCNDGRDEDPRQVISNCCDEFILSGGDAFSALQYHKYMGSYEKVDCDRY